MTISPSRLIAFDTLLRVEKDRAYAADLLHAVSLAETPHDGVNTRRDLALATEIVMGCLRRQGEIDALIALAAKRPAARLDIEVLIAARMACYQLRFLDRIPAHAAVSEGVELVKKARKKSAAGFVNALLRNLPPRADEVQGWRLSHPDWLMRRWTKHYGEEIALGILSANLKPPATYLRLNPAFDAEGTLALLASEGVATEPSGLPLARKVTSGQPEATQAYAEGRCRIQDLSSQQVVPLLDLAPTHSLLDLCAAPGGKTLQAVELRGSSQGVVAADLHPHRLRTLRSLSHTVIDCVALDGRSPLPFRAQFDRILLDAPCSGTGTLARNPEIKWRLTPSDLEDLARRQKALLGRALESLRPGGVLVYSTCSLELEENQEVLHEVLQARTDLTLGAYLERVPGREEGDGFFARAVHKVSQTSSRRRV